VASACARSPFEAIEIVAGVLFGDDDE